MKYQLVFSAFAAMALADCSADAGKVPAKQAAAAQSLYGQCGGEGYQGPTACGDGAVCSSWNPYYHQCLSGQTTFASSVVASTAASQPTEPAAPAAEPTPAKPADSPPSGAATAPSTVTLSSSVAPPSQPSKQAGPSGASPPSSEGASSGSTAAAGGTVYKASFTQYGSTDTWGSGTCNTKTAACGFYSNPGYNAAVSENFFGVGPGAGAGPGCGTCWALTPSTDSSGKKLSGAGSIVIKVNNLCPASGNPLCSQSGKTGTNQYGANVNFDLCIDDGANKALFGSSGVGLAVGTATQVDCSQWKGTDIKRRMEI